MNAAVPLVGLFLLLGSGVAVAEEAIQVVCEAIAHDSENGGPIWLSQSRPFDGQDTFELEYRLEVLDRGFDTALQRAGAPAALMQSVQVKCFGGTKSQIEKRAADRLAQQRKQLPGVIIGERFDVRLGRNDVSRFPIKPIPASRDPFVAGRTNATSPKDWGLDPEDFWLEDDSYLLMRSGLHPNGADAAKVAKTKAAAESGDHYGELLYGLYLVGQDKFQESLGWLSKANAAGLYRAADVWARVCWSLEKDQLAGTSKGRGPWPAS